MDANVGTVVKVGGFEFSVIEKIEDPKDRLYGWYRCKQMTGHPAVVGTRQYLNAKMIATGDRESSILDL